MGASFTTRPRRKAVRLRSPSPGSLRSGGRAVFEVSSYVDLPGAAPPSYPNQAMRRWWRVVIESKHTRVGASSTASSCRSTWHSANVDTDWQILGIAKTR